jgi:DNA mismatch repair protein MutS
MPRKNAQLCKIETNQLDGCDKGDQVNQDNAKEDLKIHDEYALEHSKMIAKYGTNTILLYQNGLFYEIYGLKCPKTGIIEPPMLADISSRCQMAIAHGKMDAQKNKQVIFAGFNISTMDKFVPMIISAGYTAVVYNQEAKGTKNSKSQKIQRSFDAVYSAGTYITHQIDSAPQMTNNIMCIWLDTYTNIRDRSKQKVVYGIATANTFTGESTIFEHNAPLLITPATFDELERNVSVILPSEVIVITSLSQENTRKVLQYCGITTLVSVIYSNPAEMDNKAELVANCQKQTYIQKILATYFCEDAFFSCKEFSENIYATYAFCYLLHFMKERNPDLLRKIAVPTFHNTSSRVVLGNHTLKQLNIIGDGGINGVYNESQKYSSLTNLTNHCISAMGRRKFASQLANPTFEEGWLNKEYMITAALLDGPEIIDMIRMNLRDIRDLEKVARQIVLKKVYPNSIYHLFQSIQKIRYINIGLRDYPQILEYLCGTFIPSSSSYGGAEKEGSSPFSTVEKICLQFIDFLEKRFYIEKCKDVCSTTTFDESIIQPKISVSLDETLAQYKSAIFRYSNIQCALNSFIRNSSSSSGSSGNGANDDTVFVKIYETEKSGKSLHITTKRATLLRELMKGVKILKITNEFSIPVSDIKIVSVNSSTSEIQSPQIAELERAIQHGKIQVNDEIAKAYSQNIKDLEQEFYNTMEYLIKYTSLADIIQCKAHIARTYHYCRPQILESTEDSEDTISKSSVKIVGLRHPLIEHIQKNEIYVTNDIDLEEETTGILLYGTNAVGKTSFIRAIGMCVIMAQAGLYVPADQFIYKPYTAIYSRIIGNDNLFKGLSTFAVEMSELRVILKHADQNSLVLGDELCSGTETESALAIFTAGIMNLYDKGATFLFATHFHEILKYEEIRSLLNERLAIKHMAVHYDREAEVLVYDRKLRDGPGNRMYGLEVCKSLYLEPEFLETAHQIRNKYNPENRGDLEQSPSRYNASKIRGICEICRESIGQEVHHLSPQKSADADGFIGHFHKNHPANLANICEKCHDEIHRSDGSSESLGNNVCDKTRKKTTNGYKVL